MEKNLLRESLTCRLDEHRAISSEHALVKRLAGTDATETALGYEIPRTLSSRGIGAIPRPIGPSDSTDTGAFGSKSRS